VIAFGTFLFCKLYVRWHPTIAIADFLENGETERRSYYCQIDAVGYTRACGVSVF